MFSPIARGRGCRLACLGTGETQFVHLKYLAASTRYVDNQLLTTGLEEVLTEIARFEVNAVPYQAGDILNVVGIVEIVRQSGIISNKSSQWSSKPFIFVDTDILKQLFPRDPAGFLF